MVKSSPAHKAIFLGGGSTLTSHDNRERFGATARFRSEHRRSGFTSINTDV